MAMNSDSISLIAWLRHDLKSDAMQMWIVHVDTGEPVGMQDGGFLLRITKDTATSAERCHIRHITSGREAYVQGGPNLRAFFKDCVLKRDEAGPDATDQPQA